MAYTFRQQLIDPNRYAYSHPTKRNSDGTKAKVYKSSYSMTPKYITVHNTANDASAKNEANYHNRVDNHNTVSYHVAIDDVEAVQVLPFNRNAFHCGDGSGVNSGNRTSIGVEICYSKSGGARYAKAEENAVHYLATLLKQYGWGVDRLKQHYDWSKKNCPHRIRDEKRWASFVARVKAQLDLLNKPVAKTAPTPPAQSTAKEAEEVKLNDTGRQAIRNIIKKAVADGTFTSKHENVAKYNDGELISYLSAYIDRKMK